MQEHILLHIVSLIEHYYPDSAAAHQNNLPLSPAENTAADSLPRPGTYTAERTSLLPAAHSTAAAGASQFPAARHSFLLRIVLLRGRHSFLLRIALLLRRHSVSLLRIILRGIHSCFLLEIICRIYR